MSIDNHEINHNTLSSLEHGRVCFDCICWLYILYIPSRREITFWLGMMRTESFTCKFTLMKTGWIFHSLACSSCTFRSRHRATYSHLDVCAVVLKTLLGVIPSQDGDDIAVCRKAWGPCKHMLIKLSSIFLIQLSPTWPPRTPSNQKEGAVWGALHETQGGAALESSESLLNSESAGAGTAREKGLPIDREP